MAESSVGSSFNRLAFASQIGNVANANEFYAVVTLPAALESILPNTASFREKISFAIKAANIPDLSVSPLDVNFRSSKVRIPGDRDNSGTWDITVRVDVNTVVRDIFEAWNDALNGTVNHDVAEDFDLDITSLFGVGEVHQLSRNGKILKSWAFDGIWPSSIGGLTYDWSSENTIMEFTTSLVFQHMESNGTRNNVISDAGRTSGTPLF